MPHAENGDMSSQTVNGDQQQSAFLSHLTSYPVIKDSIHGFKSNPIGQMSVDLVDQSYSTFGKPLLPYLSRPYQYVSPYVRKADNIADHGLSRVEETFPVVKTPTEDLKNGVKATVFFPVRVAFEGKDYVFKTWDDQYKSTGGNGITRPVRAMISTGLVVTSDSLSWLSEFIGAKKEQAKQTMNEKTNG